MRRLPDASLSGQRPSTKDSVACGLYRQMSREHTTSEMWGNLEYPACLLCGSERREFPFHLHEPYSVALCTACGFHYLYPGLIKTAMQEAYRQSSYYEDGTCGYADTSYTAQESALRATFKRLLRSFAKHGLTGGYLLEIGCSYGLLRGGSLLLMLTSGLSGTILPRVRYVYSTGRENFPWPECFTKTFARGIDVSRNER